MLGHGGFLVPGAGARRGKGGRTAAGGGAPFPQWTVLAAAVPLLAACDGPQSALDPAGPFAREVAALWWGMLAAATVVLAAVTALWVRALRRGPRELGAEEARRVSRRWMVGGGLILPGASIVVLLGFGIPAGHRMLPLPAAGAPPLRIDVVARQWEWEVRYPESGAVFLDELHLPAGQPVDIHLTSEDVIHSFWVPRLAGKMDALPGRTNVLRLQADRPAVMRGQCAEYCGVEHAHMALKVQVHEADAFPAWLAARAASVPRSRRAEAVP